MSNRFRRQWRTVVAMCAVACALTVACAKSKTKSHASAASSEPEVGTTKSEAAAAPQTAGRRNAPPIPYFHAPVAKESLVVPPLTAPPEAINGPSGVRMQLIRKGSGEAPGPTDTIIVDYSMWTTDGTLVRSSYMEESSPPFSVATLSPPLRSMLTALNVGAKARYWLPRAAHESWRPQDWPDADLVIELELKDVNHVQFSAAKEESVDVRARFEPPDAAGPPANATPTRGGLRFVILAKGTGRRRPAAGERLALTLDGYAIDGLVPRTVARQLKSATTLERAPGTLSDVLAQMKDGDTARVWFPPKLGAQVIPDVGSNELVLDVTLALTE